MRLEAEYRRARAGYRTQSSEACELWPYFTASGGMEALAFPTSDGRWGAVRHVAGFTLPVGQWGWS